MKKLLKRAIRRLGLSGPLSAVRRSLDPRAREALAREGARLDAIESEHGAWLKASLVPGARPAKRVLFMGIGDLNGALQESILLKSFELAGYSPMVIAPPDPVVRRAYRMLGVGTVREWGDFFREPPERELAGILGRLRRFEDLLDLRHRGVAAGKYAASTLMRQTRLGALDIADPALGPSLRAALSFSLGSVDGALRAIDRLKPDAGVFVDRGYTPSGQLFDAMVDAGLAAYTFNTAHKNNALMLKRYPPDRRNAHPATLSEASWRALRAMPWDESRWQELYGELRDCYVKGEWFAEVGTQFNRKSFTREQLAGELGIDPSKPTAVIFPHIFWDATFFWGTDLFRDYEEWFVEAVRAAVANRNLNWLVKIHPANTVKDKRDGVKGEHSELKAIRANFGSLPPHVKLLPADSPISTFSLYSIMDYCLTVRGTPGVEASCLGINVLTAGTGRYDRLGFTIDSSSREEYLGRLARLHEIPRMDGPTTELARRYAYGVFLGRVAKLESVRMEYRQDEVATPDIQFRCRSLEEFRGSRDLGAIAGWIRSGEEDFFRLPEAAPGAPKAFAGAGKAP